jgi:hypothetical protein
MYGSANGTTARVLATASTIECSATATTMPKATSADRFKAMRHAGAVELINMTIATVTVASRYAARIRSIVQTMTVTATAIAKTTSESPAKPTNSPPTRAPFPADGPVTRAAFGAGLPG